MTIILKKLESFTLEMQLMIAFTDISKHKLLGMTTIGLKEIITLGMTMEMTLQ